ncbi:MAG TPA: hypothetical protein VMU80_20675 [Bryobacteraceae bacterium]|nr:hypothetical protein [Bryobacteraceae bacterium]HUO31648.1 hypothetical protein [Bryobacteraceae bacterium]
MSMFYVYRKGQEKPVVVKADEAKLKDGILVLTTGSKVVASFPYSEVQGWQEKGPPAA